MGEFPGLGYQPLLCKRRDCTVEYEGLRDSGQRNVLKYLDHLKLLFSRAVGSYRGDPSFS